MFEILNFESYIIFLLSAIYKKIIIAKLGANLACKCAVLVFRQFFLSPQFFLSSYCIIMEIMTNSSISGAQKCIFKCNEAVVKQ